MSTIPSDVGEAFAASGSSPPSSSGTPLCPCHGEPWIIRPRRDCGGVLRRCPVKQTEAKDRYEECHIRVRDFSGNTMAVFRRTPEIEEALGISEAA
jgi:hypothetical protein